MREGGGKFKGAQFEREVCRKLSLWVTDGESENVFWRSAMSGGRATIQLQKWASYLSEGIITETINRSQSGDISAISREGHKLIDNYYIECKFYGNLNITPSLLCNRGELYKFWRETQRQAKRYDKLPILIARQNRMPTMLWCYILNDLFSMPFLQMPFWDANCYLFDKAVQVKRKGRVIL